MKNRLTAYSAARASALIAEGWVLLASLPQRLNNVSPLWEILPGIPPYSHPGSNHLDPCAPNVALQVAPLGATFKSFKWGLQALKVKG
jgi:hypothetical protein